MFSKSHLNAKARQQQENDKRLPKGMQAGGRRGKDPRLANLYSNIIKKFEISTTFQRDEYKNTERQRNIQKRFRILLQTTKCDFSRISQRLLQISTRYSFYNCFIDTDFNITPETENIENITIIIW